MKTKIEEYRKQIADLKRMLKIHKKTSLSDNVRIEINIKISFCEASINLLKRFKNTAIIVDKTANHNEIFIDNFNDNCSLKENAMQFKNIAEAEKYIAKNKFENWAVAKKYLDC